MKKKELKFLIGSSLCLATAVATISFNLGGSSSSKAATGNTCGVKGGKFNVTNMQTYANTYTSTVNPPKNVKNPDPVYNIDKYNPDYPEYATGKYGDKYTDCCNFTSQCLWAGGLIKFKSGRIEFDEQPTWNFPLDYRDPKCGNSYTDWFCIVYNPRGKKTEARDKYKHTQSWTSTEWFYKMAVNNTDQFEIMSGRPINYITYNNIKVGDIIQQKYSSKDEPGWHGHNMICMTSNPAGVYISSHTRDQKNQFAKDTDSRRRNEPKKDGKENVITDKNGNPVKRWSSITYNIIRVKDLPENITY